METVTLTDVSVMKQLFRTGSAFRDWRVAYHSARSVFLDEDAVNDPEFMRDAMECTLRLGLSADADRECYLDAIRYLSTAYLQLGQHEEALNCLQTTLEYTPDAPDWVYHQVVFAQNQTADIERNLRNPALFLEDLSHDDSGEESVRQRQQNIFKHFLANAVVFLTEHPGAKVDLQQLEDAAKTYGVKETDAWTAFAGICRGGQDEKLLSRIREYLKRAEDADGEGRGADQAYIALFSVAPEPDAELTEQQSELLQRAEAAEEELRKTEEELERMKKAQSRAGSGEDMADAFGQLMAQIMIVTKELCHWLNRKFIPKMGDRWKSCVDELLNGEGSCRTMHYTKLEEYDLMALLKIYKNYRRELGERNNVDVSKLFDIRNRWAHFSMESLTKKQMSTDLKKLSAFLEVLGSSHVMVSRMKRLAGELDS